VDQLIDYANAVNLGFPKSFQGPLHPEKSVSDSPYNILEQTLKLLCDCWKMSTTADMFRGPGMAKEEVNALYIG